MDATETRYEALVLGIGNLLWGDEGFGVRAAEQLDRDYALEGHATVIDGGTQGLYLVPTVQAARRLLILDAVDFGLAPGTVKVLRDGEVPRFASAKKIDLHQTSFMEVLHAAELLGTAPEAIALVGVQPEDMGTFGSSLSETVRARLPEVLAIVRAQLADWGIDARPRANAVSGPGIAGPGMDLATYEHRKEEPQVPGTGSG